MYSNFNWIFLTWQLSSFFFLSSLPFCSPPLFICEREQQHIATLGSIGLLSVNVFLISVWGTQSCFSFLLLYHAFWHSHFFLVTYSSSHLKCDIYACLSKSTVHSLVFIITLYVLATHSYLDWDFIAAYCNNRFTSSISFALRERKIVQANKFQLNKKIILLFVAYAL